MDDLLDYTERTNAVDHTDFYNIHIETPSARIGTERRSENSCPFCGSKLDLVVHLRHHQTGEDLFLAKLVAKTRGKEISRSFNDIMAYNCINCGWWRVENIQPALETIDYILPTLRKFSVEAKDLPLGILWMELLKKPDEGH